MWCRQASVKFGTSRHKFLPLSTLIAQPMNEDEGFDDFSYDDLSEEEKRELDRQLEEEDRRVKNHPLNVQAREIKNMIDVLLDTCGDEEAREQYGSTMRDSAMIILAKLASGLSSDDYVLSMQKAALIRDHAEYLRLSNHMLDSAEVFDKAYVKAFRDEMEKFRELFREWAAEIREQTNDFEDEWGLFMK